ncbi:hypothetical protein [Psychrobacillus sp. NPDC096623]|uniref:hypothetical protein n=1 Tax=Psychrobacillus sp. NPDC096623 TaxID=3364492 RepID=UPI0037F9224F
MNKQKSIYLIVALILLLLTSACGTQVNSETSGTKQSVPFETIQEESEVEDHSSANSEPSTIEEQSSANDQEKTTDQDESAKAGSSDEKTTNQTETNQVNTAAGYVPVKIESEILIIIDQTSKPIEGNSFDFVVNKVPEGFSLTEIQWISEKTQVINTVQEAIQHGANGEEGFYISGNGQYSGFIYPDSMKGEEGQVVFIFKDAKGKELTWKKTITLY